MASFVVCLKKFFGTKPHQTLKEFVAEVKELTPKDREELAGMLEKEGYEVDAEVQK